MGRVDDAMRRAAESGGTPDRTGVGPAAIGTVGRSATVVPLEAFPAEPPERPQMVVNGQPVEPAPVQERRVRPRILPSLSDRIDARLAQKVVVDARIDPVSREQYRRLATTLYAAQAENGMKVVMVASAMASEGKTLTATNLALTLSESYQRAVLLIDGDLRKPSLHTVFQLDAEPGLSEGLTSSIVKKLPIHRVTDHLSVLTAGQPNHNPMAALASDRMGQLIQEARQTFEWIILDTPPVGLLSDASLMGGFADGTLFVVKAEVTPFELVQRAVAAIGKTPILGVVLNRAGVAPGKVDNKYYTNYYGAPTAPVGG